MILKNINFILIFCFSFSFGQNSELFDQGNELYNNGNYYEAIEKYSSIVKSGKHSDKLYYNMGNSYYKLNDIANSIYYYEKALLLNPNSETINNNLVFAQNMLIDKIEILPENQISVFTNSVTKLFNYNTWQYLFIFFEYLAIFLFFLYMISKIPSLKKKLFISSISSTILFLLFLIIANNSKNISENNNPAIIFDKQIELREEPNLRSEEIIKLHEGTKLNILESINDWSLIQLKNGNKGWILTSSFRTVK